MHLPINIDIAVRELVLYLEDGEYDNYITERVNIINGFVKNVPITTSTQYNLNHLEQLNKFIPKLSPIARKKSERQQKDIKRSREFK